MRISNSLLVYWTRRGVHFSCEICSQAVGAEFGCRIWIPWSVQMPESSAQHRELYCLYSVLLTLADPRGAGMRTPTSSCSFGTKIIVWRPHLCSWHPLLLEILDPPLIEPSEWHHAPFSLLLWHTVKFQTHNITSNYHQIPLPRYPMAFVVPNVVEVLINKKTFWISYRVNDRTAESVVITGNDVKWVY